MTIKQTESGVIFDGPNAVEIFRLTSVKAALRLESKGIQVRRGPKLRKQWATYLGLKPNTSYEDLISHITGLIETRLTKERGA